MITIEIIVFIFFIIIETKTKNSTIALLISSLKMFKNKKNHILIFKNLHFQTFILIIKKNNEVFIIIIIMKYNEIINIKIS